MKHLDHDQVRLRIHPGMDVWDAYQEHYLGSVTHVWRGISPVSRGARAEEKEVSVQSHPLKHEEGHVGGHASNQGERRNGESMGPFPTESVGNGGPAAQSAEADYATHATDGQSNVISFAVRPGRLNLGILTRPYYIPSSAVHSVSMERVVVNVRGSAIPKEWRQRPRR